jgi:hypothetical protein
LGDASVELRAPSLSEASAVCDGERFAAQPAAALCSASLIADDLVLTAGHCLGPTREAGEDRCRRLWIVFDYHLEEDGSIALGMADDVYACRRVVYHAKQTSKEDVLDIAVLQLDRTAAGRTPIRVASGRPEIGDRLLSATHGAGLPLKVEDGATVLDVPEGAKFFIADTDSFAGGSGGALLNEDLELVGHQVSGQPDWAFSEDGCARGDTSGKGMELHQIAAVAEAALCGAGWPSERLCNREGECGDHVCGSRESTVSCERDCPEPSCGDGLCELSERRACADDCRAFENVPASWSDDPLDYQLVQGPIAVPVPGSSGNDEESRGGCTLGGRVSRAWVAESLAVLVVGWGRRSRRRHRLRESGRRAHSGSWHAANSPIGRFGDVCISEVSAVGTDS